VAGVLVSIGGDVVDLARQGGISGGSLGSLLDGDDPGEAFLRYIGQLAGALAAAQGVSLALRYSDDERSGRLETAVTTGNRPLRILLSSWLVAALGSGLTLICATVAAGHVGRSELDTDMIDAVRLVAGQWPAALASAAIASALCGAWPRGRGLAWAPVLVGLGVAQLGGVLDLPRWVRDAGAFAQAGETGSLWLVVICTVCLITAAFCVTRRDMDLVTSSRRGIPCLTVS
jgi:membrane protein